jgi:hypothetical protein
LRANFRSLRTCLVVAGALFAAVSPAIAQTAEGPPDPSKVRVRIGPLLMNPTIALNNMGVDNNVFNDATAPKQDFTVTLTPKTDLWLRMGRTWLKGTIKEDVVWFQKYTSERSANNTYTLKWNVPLNRLSASTSATWLKTRERPGFEIDSRSQRGQQAYSASAEIRALSKTFIGVRGDWSMVDFDKNALFRGTNLQEQLNRNARSVALTLRHQLTPLTSLTFNAGESEDRFDVSKARNSKTRAFDAGVTFDPFALIKGNVTFGYHDFQPASSDVPGYQGSTMSVNLGYTLLGATRFGVQAIRDVQYSYDVNQPYYLLTGFSGSIAQQIFGPFDVVGRAGAERLEYRTRAGAVVLEPDRTDHVQSYGVGVGYHFGQSVRLGVDADHQRRTSPIPANHYKGMRYGTSLTYGF